MKSMKQLPLGIALATGALFLAACGDTGPGADSPANPLLRYVPADTPGVTQGKPLNKLGQRDMPQGEIFFDDVRLPADYMVIPPELYPIATEMILTGANGGMGSIFVGVAQAALDLALDYARERVQGGVPNIGSSRRTVSPSTRASYTPAQFTTAGVRCLITPRNGANRSSDWSGLPVSGSRACRWTIAAPASAAPIAASAISSAVIGRCGDSWKDSRGRRERKYGVECWCLAEVRGGPCDCDRSTVA